MNINRFVYFILFLDAFTIFVLFLFKKLSVEWMFDPVIEKRICK